MKVSVIGAGNVGAIIANVIVQKNFDINLDGPEYKFFKASVGAARETNKLMLESLKAAENA